MKITIYFIENTFIYSQSTCVNIFQNITLAILEFKLNEQHDAVVYFVTLNL